MFFLLLHGQNDNLSRIDGVGVFQPVGVALKNSFVLADLAVLSGGSLAQGVTGLDGIQLLTGSGHRGGNQGALPNFSGRVITAPSFRATPLLAFWRA